MADLWDVLGYDEVANRIAATLAESSDIVVIEGPPGVGKSWLANGIGVLWEENDGVAVIAQGDPLRGNVRLDPFAMLVRLSSRWKSLIPAAANAAKIGESLLGTFGLITTAVQVLTRLRDSQRRERAILLDDGEQQVLYELERRSSERPLLLIADNLHSWDSASLAFLARLREPRMVAAFPFLAELRVIATQTVEPYQTVLHTEAHAALLSPSRTRTFTLERIQLDRFGAVLTAMGVDPPPREETVHAVYALSGGNLALARRWVDRTAGGHAAASLGATDADNFVDRLLSERIRALGPVGQQAVALLQIAAVLGLTFRRDEVGCAAEGESAQMSKLLRFCRDEGVLEIVDDVCRFVHEVYRQHFLNSGASNRTDIHERLAECLRVLRPSEYELRCINALDAERLRDAGALAVHAGLQREREGGSWRDLPAQFVGVIDNADLGVVLEGLSTALRHLNAYRFAECLTVLDRLPHGALSKSLVAEADYLEAMCLMSTRSEDDRARGRAILKGWEGFESEEPEIGLRLMLLLLYGLTHIRDKSEGFAKEALIKQLLIDRATFDSAARDTFYTLDRCAGSLYSPDVALIRTGEAARHFGPADEGSLIRRPVEYYRCMVNYGANLICNARYAAAHTVYEQLLRLVDGYAQDTFPRLDYPLMNDLLAQYRSGDITADEAVERQREIAAMAPPSDPFYVRNALAVYLTLSGEIRESLELFDELDRELIRSRRVPEPSMVYLIRSNRSGARYVCGDRERARVEWDELSDVVDRIAYVTRDYLVRRHELLRAALAEDLALTGPQWDERLLDPSRMEFGPLWDNYGRGFRLPEIEFWREN